MAAVLAGRVAMVHFSPVGAAAVLGLLAQEGMAH
jgi:hypothetical protein